MKNALVISLLLLSANAQSDLKEQLNLEIDTIMDKVVEWRHDIHEHPELGNREFRTAKKLLII
jgi:amidohydrolase